ncbi:uncharacterized protein BDW43DRAFT_295514 [Aspergillus alliaceus]|uniref:uncharacterized protein n=1 Tax=Petromyces alliaceus TaxID=209559 RepID=UPI0012A60806|nr:uncharacterized protein BDW43DRAFT_295514 [Aspergillus alliaceus]KAB8226876.1 hypothetical protein BDW43DRAFT_295514 [Aspergillus alliaceus]
MNSSATGMARWYFARSPVRKYLILLILKKRFLFSAAWLVYPVDKPGLPRRISPVLPGFIMIFRLSSTRHSLVLPTGLPIPREPYQNSSALTS